MNETSFIKLGNRRAAPAGALPALDAEAFREVVVDAVGEGWRIVSYFGVPESPRTLRLVAVLADDARGRLSATSAVVGQQHPSVASVCPQAAVFEREIAEQCGVIPVGHPALIPLRRHPADHRPSEWEPAATQREFASGPFDSDEVHDVAVGPVHAGIIEPGHFRFQVHGEEVLHLEIVLGYQHRGVESLLETLDRQRAVLVAESIAGDSVIAHTSAWCGAIEALSRTHKSARAQSVRGIALEVERLANHVGDLGALAGDVAYQPAAAFFGRMRGECLNILMTISGNRYGRGLVRPGGVAYDITPDMATEVAARLHRLERELTPVAELFFGAGSVQSRLERVGTVSQGDCVTNGFVGMVARACDLHLDVRHDHAYGAFRYAQIPVATAWSGDVYGRALVRWLEIRRSLEFVREQLDTLPTGEPRVPCAALAPDEIVVALEEGWRGEIVHTVMTGHDGGIRRHKVTDPSFHNWAALAAAMRGNQISDFPLCNKSFNLSYAGHDL